MLNENDQIETQIHRPEQEILKMVNFQVNGK